MEPHCAKHPFPRSFTVWSFSPSPAASCQAIVVHSLSLSRSQPPAASPRFTHPCVHFSPGPPRLLGVQDGCTQVYPRTEHGAWPIIGAHPTSVQGIKGQDKVTASTCSPPHRENKRNHNVPSICGSRILHRGDTSGL